MPPLAIPPATMPDVLQHVLGVTSQGMRNKLFAMGFRDLRSLVDKGDDYAHKVCTLVRKSAGGQPAEKNIPMLVEEDLKKLVRYCRINFLLQRALNYGDIYDEILEEVNDFFEQLGDDPNHEDVPKYSDKCNLKKWFESLRNYLATKKGKAGLPILYVITDNNLAAYPQVQHPNFPEFETELKFRGRHNGKFWAADNKAVFIFLRLKCHGTNAWSTIQAFVMEDVPGLL